jgi:hypothetical protein
VIGADKLKRNYTQFEAKRKLCDSYDLFIADDSIVQKLPVMLGKRFFATKKFPLSISLADSADWQAQIDAVIRSSQLSLQGGGTLAIRVGHIVDPVEHIADNIITAMRDAASHVGGWENVRALFVKTSLSASVPVFQAAPIAREDEVKLRDKLLATSESVQTFGPVAEKARKQKLADFEAKLATDPRAAQKREFAFLFEQGIEVDDDLLSDSTEDLEKATKKPRSDSAEKDDAPVAAENGDGNDDDDDDDDENSAVMQAGVQRKNAQQKKLLAEQEAKRKRRAIGPADDDSDSDKAVDGESAAALQLKAKQIAIEKAKAKTATVKPSGATPAATAKATTATTTTTPAAKEVATPGKAAATAVKATATTPAKPTTPAAKAAVAAHTPGGKSATSTSTASASKSSKKRTSREE